MILKSLVGFHINVSMWTRAFTYPCGVVVVVCEVVGVVCGVVGVVCEVVGVVCEVVGVVCEVVGGVRVPLVLLCFLLLVK